MANTGEALANAWNNILDGNIDVADRTKITKELTAPASEAVVKATGIKEVFGVNTKDALTGIADGFISFGTDMVLTVATAGAGVASVPNKTKQAGILANLTSKFGPGYATVATLTKDYSGMDVIQKTLLVSFTSAGR